MSTAQIVWLVIVLAIVLLVALAVAALLRRRQARRAELQERFGPEYGRAVSEAGSRREAERDLLERERRHEELEIRALSPESRKRYTAAWTSTQARFVDQPVEAVGDADRILSDVMRERGYPSDDREQAMADLSVEHADVLENYRQAHAIAEQDTPPTTEELRRAMQHYRSAVEALLR